MTIVATTVDRTTAADQAASAAEPLHRRLGLTDFEAAEVERRLGRAPNDLELAIFSVMWSEHCSYKSSRHVLSELPTSGRAVVAGPGENAGAIAIAEDLTVVFKIESHNHPSAVEPYQGAATGVGGILRDVFALGARPIAVLDALRFGDPSSASTRRLVDGVVRGVGGYGNCVGIPTVGGELVFHRAYGANPLVNVMAIGLLRQPKPMRAVAAGPGNLLVLYGSTTGRDGIGGASVLASASFGDEDPSRRPSVQIGDPFMEKLILEVTLELVEGGLVEAVGDLGAGGLSCVAAEMADRAGTGVVIDLDAVHRREEGMAPFEVMISESQERMCAVVRPERVGEVLAVCRRWGLPAATVVGRVTDDGLLTVVEGGLDGAGTRDDQRVLARVPAKALASEAIAYRREARAPQRRRQAPAPGVPTEPANRLPERGTDPGAVLRALLGSPGLGSVAWLAGQYDSTVGSDTLTGPGRGAAVLRIKGTRLGLVAAVDGNAAVSALDPYLGAALSVCQAVRNVVVTGARPLGISDCLNFGDPERPEAFWQFHEAVRGISAACRALGLPVVSGNVSFYNESSTGAILPTPEIGVVGLLEEAEGRVGPAFPADGHLVVLAGEAVPGLAGSAYAELAGSAPEDGPPALDIAREAALHAFLLEAIGSGLVSAAQDVGSGGLAVALAEMAMWGGRGADLRLRVGVAPAVELFGEAPSRAVVTCRPADWERLAAIGDRYDLPLEPLGATGGAVLRVELRGEGSTGAAEDRGAGVADPVEVEVDVLRHAWEGALPRLFAQETAP